MIDIMKQGLGLRTPQQERFGNSQELKSFGGALSTALEPEFIPDTAAGSMHLAAHGGSPRSCFPR